MRFQQPVWKIIKSLLFAATYSICSISSAYAGAIASDINIVDASIAFDADAVLDDSFSYGPTTGDFSVIEGGSATTSEYAGNLVTSGVNPLDGTYAVPNVSGDGVGFSGAVNTQDDDFSIGFDSFLSVENSSLIDVYKVIFKLTYSNLVNATGADSFADSEFILFAGGIEIFFTDLLSDTLFGDEIGGVLTGNSGEELSESNTLSFDFMINPGETLDFELTWTLEGGNFETGSSIADFSQFLSIEDTILQSPPPQDVPEPASLLLFAIGMFGLLRKNRFFKIK
ncbi:PEP-CTERM sorting domain-containing protein [Candidatus Colwellia aromaticivorans]|uniref:PEP-CTERM sorting domain-containing protein n=1 Tax=Candidatus Colwellia aromaticivorans TaxID=2267621 RepID=UPI000DF1F0DA|nr:PEP-CTERM sorting domain-containing protein [Candidatus Colwellia aromaticivorans]